MFGRNAKSKIILLVFWDVFGLKIHFDKSIVFGSNLGQDQITRLALLFDCKAFDQPFPYLGLLFWGNPKTCIFWDLVIKRISQKLNRQKKFFLSLGGRITLIHLCLSHFLSYFLFFFKIPLSMALKIKKLYRDFPWSRVG